MQPLWHAKVVVLVLALCMPAPLLARAAAINYFEVNAQFAAALARLPQQSKPDLAAFTALSRSASEADPNATIDVLERNPLRQNGETLQLAVTIAKGYALLRARRMNDARALIDTLPEPAQSPDPSLVADILLLRVGIAQFTGRFEEAQRRVVELLDLLDREPASSAELRYRALSNLASIQGRMRDVKGAMDSNHKVMLLAREMGDPMLLARALLNRGQIYTVMREHEKCRALLAEVSALAQRLPPGDLSINLDLALSINAANRGSNAESKVALARALASARQQGNVYYEAFALSTVAQNQQADGDASRAAANFELSEDGFKRLSSSEDAARMAQMASAAHEQAGDLTQALAALKRTQLHMATLVNAQRDASARDLQRSLLVQRKDAEIAAARVEAERDGANAAAAALKAQLAIAAALLTAAVAVALGLWAMGLRRRNAALAQVDRTRAQTLAYAAHEIRNPLAAILGLLDLALRRAPGATVRDVLEPAHAAASALIDTTQDYLDHAQLSLGTMSARIAPFDLIALLQSVFALYRDQATRKGLTMRLDCDLAAPIWVRGDAQKLRQILSNLLGNAVKFSGSGEIALALARNATGHYQFSVSDQGPGIASDKCEAVFQPFTRAHGDAAIPGAGLGLSIAKQLTELLGGKLTMQSEIGRGSCAFFTVELPDAAATSPERKSKPESGLDVGKQVLVVDDDPHMRALLRLQLESLGARVLEASDIDDGLASWRAFRPGLVLVDYHLRDAVGSTLTAAIRAEDDGHTRLVIISASLARSQSIATEAVWIAKPLSLQTLAELLGEDARSVQ